MFSEIEQSEILKFLMLNDERKKIALSILASQNAFRKALIANFLQSLRNRLCMTDLIRYNPDWHLVDGWENDKGGKDLGLSKTSWNRYFKIVLQPYDHKKTSNEEINFGIGICCESYPEPSRAIAALNQIRSRRQTEEPGIKMWPYCFAVKKEYSRWITPEDLARLTVGSDALNYFSAEIVSLATEAEKIIDDLVNQPSKD